MNSHSVKKRCSSRSRCFLITHAFLMLLIVGSIWPVTAIAMEREAKITGQTMGTVYQVKLVTENEIDAEKLKKSIENRLKKINQSMSTYIPDSEISRFNDLDQVGQTFKVSEDFWTVMIMAKQVYGLTEGAWDGTVAPLVNLWGFGSKKTVDRVPSETVIHALLPAIGFDLIEMGAGRQLGKRDAAVTLDLASIAKGYAVDQVARLLRKKGFHHYLVEIGGETFAAGHRLDGQPWRGGINRPERNAPFDAVYKVISLSDRALATSGDYRNYFESNGRFYGHVLDPRNGYPVANGIVSVSVLADTCVLADGLATGMMVMGVEKGLSLVERFKQVECLIVVRSPDGRLSDHMSRAFQAENIWDDR